MVKVEAEAMEVDEGEVDQEVEGLGIMVRDLSVNSMERLATQCGSAFIDLITTSRIQTGQCLVLHHLLPHHFTILLEPTLQHQAQ